MVLSLTTGPFAKGTESAIKATKALDDQLKLQIATFGKTAEETQEYILALKGVDAATIQSLKVQQQQLAALKEQETARQAAIKTQAAAQAAALKEQEAARAAALRSQAAAQEAAAKAQAQADAQVQRARDANRSRGEEITNSLRTAEEHFAQEQRELNHLLKVGAINQQTFNRAMEGARSKLPQVEKQAGFAARAIARLRGIGGGGGGQGIGSRLSPLGIGPGGLTALGIGFAAVRFTKNSLKAFSETPEGKDLKATMDGLNKSTEQIEVSFGKWLSQTVALTAGLKNLHAGMNVFNPSAGSQAAKSVAERSAVLGGDATRFTAEKQLRANLKQQEEIQAKIRDANARVGSGGLLNRLTLGATVIPNLQEVVQLQQQLKILEAEQNVLLPAAGFESGAGGRLRRREPTLPTQDKLDRQFDTTISLFGKLGANLSGKVLTGISALNDQFDKLDSGFQNVEAQARDFMKAFQISQGQMSPLESFKKDTEEIRRLFDKGFLGEGDFNAALLDERRKLEQFVGLNDPLPSRVAGARRGSAEAFARVAAFQDQSNSPVQRSLDELVDLAKRQLKLEEDAARNNRNEGDSLGTIDTKP